MKVENYCFSLLTVFDFIKSRYFYFSIEAIEPSRSRSSLDTLRISAEKFALLSASGVNVISEASSADTGALLLSDFELCTLSPSFSASMLSGSSLFELLESDFLLKLLLLLEEDLLSSLSSDFDDSYSLASSFLDPLLEEELDSLRMSRAS